MREEIVKYTNVWKEHVFCIYGFTSIYGTSIIFYSRLIRRNEFKVHAIPNLEKQ